MNILKFNLKRLKFNRLTICVKHNIKTTDISNLKTKEGDTQNIERKSIELIKNCLDKLGYYYETAGSQQPKDFRNVCKIGLDVEIKKTDSFIVYFNDTLPSIDTYYIILFTGKKYKNKNKKDIHPQLIFINGYDLVKPDIYYLLDYQKDMEEIKDKWARKKENNKANKFKYFSVYPRPTYKTDIRHLLDFPQPA